MWYFTLFCTLCIVHTLLCITVVCTQNGVISLLLQDYDWRQYTSRDDGSHDWKLRDGGSHREELALRERLEEVRPTRQTSVEVMDNSLTGSTSMVSRGEGREGGGMVSRGRREGGGNISRGRGVAVLAG